MAWRIPVILPEATSHSRTSLRSWFQVPTARVAESGLNASGVELPFSSCGMRRTTWRSDVSISQIPSPTPVSGELGTASSRPSGLMANHGHPGNPIPALNGRSRRWLPERSHTTTSRFRSVVYAVVPSAESAGPRSGRSPVSASVVRTDAVATSQIRSRESFPTVTTERPSGVKVTPAASYLVLYGP
jgi:hypothetical protein